MTKALALVPHSVATNEEPAHIVDTSLVLSSPHSEHQTVNKDTQLFAQAIANVEGRRAEAAADSISSDELYKQAVERAIPEPVTFTEHAAHYLANNRDHIARKMRSGLQDASVAEIHQMAANVFVFNQLIFPEIADKIEFKLTHPVKIKEGQSDRNYAIRALFNGPLSNFHYDAAATSLLETLMYHQDCDPRGWGFVIKGNGYSRGYKSKDFFRIIEENVLEGRESITLKELVEGIKETFIPQPRRVEEMRKQYGVTPEDLYARVGISMWLTHKRSKKQEGENHHPHKIDLKSDSKIQEYIDFLIKYLSEVDRPRQGNSSSEMPRSLEKVIPTFENFPRLRQQLEVHMIRTGVANNLNTAIACDSEDATSEFDEAAFFKLMDARLFSKDAQRELYMYDVAPKLRTLREFAHKLLGELVEPEEKTPSKPALRELYESKWKGIEEVAHLYDYIYLLCQHYKIGQTSLKSGIPEIVKQGEILIEKIRLQLEQANEMAVKIESKIEVPNFNIDEIRDGMIALGMLMQSSRLDQALSEGYEISGALQAGAEVVDPDAELVERFDALERKEGGK